MLEIVVTPKLLGPPDLSLMVNPRLGHPSGIAAFVCAVLFTPP